MLDNILLIDRYCFIFINSYLSNPVFDLIMPIFDETRNLLPIMLLPYFIAIIIDKKNRWKLAILIPLIIILADQTGLLLKKTILRPRPWADMDQDFVIHLVSQKGKNYSFPSNHAANMSGLAMVFSSVYKQFKYIFWFIAVVVIFSRVYIGVHYPSDVIAGWLIGTFFGALLIQSWKYFKKSNP